MIKVFKSYKEYHHTKCRSRKNIILSYAWNRFDYQLIIDSRNCCLENATGATRFDKISHRG